MLELHLRLGLCLGLESGLKLWLGLELYSRLRSWDYNKLSELVMIILKNFRILISSHGFN